MRGKAIMKANDVPVMVINNKGEAIKLTDLPAGRHTADDGSHCIVVRDRTTTEIHYHKGIK